MLYLQGQNMADHGVLLQQRVEEDGPRLRSAVDVE